MMKKLIGMMIFLAGSAFVGATSPATSLVSTALPEAVSHYATAMGHIILKCDYEQAEVYVDGKPMGPASLFDGKNGSLKLSPGMHRIILLHQGKAFKYHVRVEADRRLELTGHFGQTF